MPLGIVNKSQFDVERGGCKDSHVHKVVVDIIKPEMPAPIIKDTLDKFFSDMGNSEDILDPCIDTDDLMPLDRRGLFATGRGEGNIHTPEVLRKVIAGEFIEGGDALDIQEAFKISRSSISAYVNGSTSTTTYNDTLPQLSNHNKLVKEKIVKKARSLTRQALRHINPDKLAGCNAVQLASVANQLSKVALDNEPVNKTETKIEKVVTYRPRIREEDSFEIIDVRD